MKLNFFRDDSKLYPFRWFIVITTFLLLFMVWHDVTGGRMFTTSGPKPWTSSGSGFHK